MKPIMAKATAVWLVDDTSLTFQQIADFCEMHILEIEGIANGEVAVGILGSNPIENGQLDRDEISKGEADSEYKMKLKEAPWSDGELRRIGTRYTPVSRRQDRPAAILWLLKNHPELEDSKVCSLIGTTKSTVESIRSRTHWNISNLQPVDPVSLGLCRQGLLDEAVADVRERRQRELDRQTSEDGETIVSLDKSLAEDSGNKAKSPLSDLKDFKLTSGD